jgi:hypothetical protein
LKKSRTTDLEHLGMEANLKEIKHLNGTYDVSFHGLSGYYNVDIDVFSPDSIIELEISDGSNSFTSLVDVRSKSIDIENDNLYTFSELEKDSISTSSSVLFRITTSIIAHHNQNPRTSVTFLDNGNSDSFPDEDDAAAVCFWCSSAVTNEFYPGLCVDITTTSMFWGTFENESVGDAYVC